LVALSRIVPNDGLSLGAIFLNRLASTPESALASAVLPRVAAAHVFAMAPADGTAGVAGLVPAVPAGLVSAIPAADAAAINTVAAVIAPASRSPSCLGPTPALFVPGIANDAPRGPTNFSSQADLLFPWQWPIEEKGTLSDRPTWMWADGASPGGGASMLRVEGVPDCGFLGGRCDLHPEHHRLIASSIQIEPDQLSIQLYRHDSDSVAITSSMISDLTYILIGLTYIVAGLNCIVIGLVNIAVGLANLVRAIICTITPLLPSPPPLKICLLVLRK